MSLYSICQAIQDSDIGTQIRESVWVFPIIETTHVLGLAVSVGVILMLDMRLIGVGVKKAGVLEVMNRLLPWYMTGFIIMMLSGALLFWSEAEKLYRSPTFRWKLLFLVLAGLNAAYFEWVTKPKVPAWDGPSAVPTREARIVGWASIVCWSAVIGFGRWTAYGLK